ncbi:peptidoglycan editing factor PgeF [Shimia ponticola]|uniref:peptidoglycan editing factor PgeF n=1 Tax=Shimia ponticola TaxID=2582893 RepID=UPI0011BF08FC|nr:peptidoglycan editing factor PgeF [Shimia ponticola]
MALEIITADGLDGIRHGFFTRRGGASSGVFNALNCGMGSSDQAEIVQMNRARVAEAIGVPHSDLITQYQVHSADVVTVRSAQDRDETADAMVTNVPGLALGILTADCQPILFADTQAGVVGAAHAGWKGARQGVIETTVAAMEALGADRGQIRAAIGPSISQAAYEVGPEFFEAFVDDDPETSRFFANGKDGRYQFDLTGYGLQCLRDAGVETAEWTRHCTYADPARFFSYRRSVHAKEADYGRLISVIRL